MSATALLGMQIGYFPNALCRSVNPELMTPASTESDAFAKSVCCKCEHKRECLDFALRNREFGIWGGTDDRQREAMLSANARLGGGK